jgi:hypothetical protein
MLKRLALLTTASVLCVSISLVARDKFALAQSSGPTLAKCTCRLDDKAPPDSDGARAANATLCVQMLNQGHKWCEITVACLRGNIGPQCGAGSSPKSALLPLYAFAVAQITQTGGPALSFMGPRFDANRNAVDALSQKNNEVIDECVRYYRSQSKEKGITAEGGGFACAYDQTTGWLAIAFFNPPDLVQFSFGPRD